MCGHPPRIKELEAGRCGTGPRAGCRAPALLPGCQLDQAQTWRNPRPRPPGAPRHTPQGPGGRQVPWEGAQGRAGLAVEAVVEVHPDSPEGLGNASIQESAPNPRG